MDLQNFNQRAMEPQAQAIPRTFLANVFSYMAAALVISGVCAYLFGTSMELMSLLAIIDPYTEMIIGRTMLGWIVMLSPFAFILLMNFKLERFSAPTLLMFFIAFAITMGMSLSYIFWFYEMGILATTFFITAGTFTVMAIAGYTTKTDLSKMGSLLTMALFGLIIAMIATSFMENSSTMDYVINILGVIIFTGLIAWETQDLKRIGEQVGTGNEMATKMAIMGAMTLYLSFINLFLFLLRLLSSRD